MTRTVYRRRLNPLHPQLGRHINHDSRSRLYTYNTTDLQIQDTTHTINIPPLDQGAIGSCTGNAGIGCLATEPYYHATTQSTYAYDETGAVHLYSDATQLDKYAGQYPPDDTGSDGLSIAKALKKAGAISGYQHVFSLDAALKALTQRPFITGINWYTAMFQPNPDGQVLIGGGLAGGHEVFAWRLDATNQRVWFRNSWGPTWGIDGSFYLTFEDYGHLLEQEGDVTIFVPAGQPTPTPPVDPDQALAAAFRRGGWVTDPHIGENAYVAHAAQRWLAAKDL